MSLAKADQLFQSRCRLGAWRFGDFDNDGAVDVLISSNNEPPVLLQNRAGGENYWLGIKLVGKKANIDAVGAGPYLPSRQSKTQPSEGRWWQLPVIA